MIDAASTIAGLIVGGGLGAIAGGLFAGAKNADLREKLVDEECFTEALHEINEKALAEVNELRAWKNAVLGGLRKNTAARKQAKIDRDNASRALRNARHAEMRELVGEVI